METSKRRFFLDAFLTLLGAESINYTNADSAKIFGTVIYVSSDPSERQDFCWHMTEQSVPSDDVLRLIQFIQDNKLIDVDKIIIPFTEIFKKMELTDHNRFMTTAVELTNVNVRMIDDGKETDSYFVHD